MKILNYIYDFFEEIIFNFFYKDKLTHCFHCVTSKEPSHIDCKLFCDCYNCEDLRLCRNCRKQYDFKERKYNE